MSTRQQGVETRQSTCLARKSLLDLPDDVVRRIVTATGPSARLISRRFRTAAPVLQLHPRLPPDLPTATFLASAFSQDVLRHLTSLDLSSLSTQTGDQHDLAASTIITNAAAACTALRTLHLGCLPSAALSLLVQPGAALLSTLQSLTCHAKSGSLRGTSQPPQGLDPQPRHARSGRRRGQSQPPQGLDPLTRLTALRGISITCGNLSLAPVFALSQLTRLELNYGDDGRGGGGAIEEAATRLPHLAYLDLHADMHWSATMVAHLATMTTLTSVELCYRFRNPASSQEFFRALAALPRLHAASFWFWDHDADPALAELFRPTPTGPAASEAAAHPPPTLRSLDIRLAPHESTPFLSITSTLHGSASLLTHLRIDGGHHPHAGYFWDEEIDGLNHLVKAAPRLRSLALEFCRFETDYGFDALGPLSRLAGTLTALAFRCCGGPDPEVLTCLTQLKVLRVDDPARMEGSDDEWCDLPSILEELEGKVKIEFHPWIG